MLDEILWNEARADAGVLDLEIDAFPYHAQRPDHLPEAAYFRPGEILAGAEAAVLSPGQRHRFDAHPDRHRILLATSEAPEVLGALLRHELEHVRQNEAGGSALFLVYQAAMAGVENFVGEDRRGSAVLYNIVPLEMDANAAAARFMRARLQPAQLDKLSASAYGVLFRPEPPPGTVETAGRRTVSFASLAADRVEQWLANDARATLDAVAGIAGLWDRLRSDQELRRLSAAALELVPDTAALDAAEPEVRTGWQPLREALLVAYMHARSIADG